MDDVSNECTEDELHALFAKLFPRGFAGADVKRGLGIDDWRRSPLRAVFHPTPDQQLEEAVRVRENVERMALAFGKNDTARPPDESPTMADFVADSEDDGVPDEELARLIGLCLWDIFSDNHDVVDDEGRELRLGSARGSAGFLADRLNEQVNAGVVPKPAFDAAMRSEEVMKSMRAAMPEMNNELLFHMMREQQTGPFDYMDFYMGSGAVAHRADVSPVYRLLFTRLKALDLDWHYSFPRLHLVDLRPLKEHLDAERAEEAGEPEWAGYDPERELAKNDENREKDRELDRMRDSLDEGYRESVAAALNEPPPAIVVAYRDVFGEWPAGWPPAL